MFIEENNKIKAVDNNDVSYTGKVFKIVIQPCEDDNNKPHALVFISQDKEHVKNEGEFGCASLWVDKLKSIELLEK